MTRRRRFLWASFCVIVIAMTLCTTVVALPSASAGKEPGLETADASEDFIAKFEESLPDEVRDDFISADSTETLVGFEYLFSKLLAAVGKGSIGALKTLLVLIGITTLGTLASLLAQDKEGKTKSLSLLLVGAICALSFYQALSDTMTRVTEYLKDLEAFSIGLAPTLGGILIAGGATATGALTVVSMEGLLLLFQKLCTDVLLPLTGACFAFALLSGVSEELHLDGISKNLRGVYMTVLGVMCTVATASFSMQTLLAASADTVTLKTARYAVGNMIPIVGTTIGASLGTLGASLGLIKSTVGVGAVAVVLLLAIPVLVDLYLMRLAVSLCGAFARLTGFTTGEKLLVEFRGIFDMTLAIAAFTSLVFLLYLGIFLKTALPIVG